MLAMPRQWFGVRDSNPRQAVQSRPSYRWTNPEWFYTVGERRGSRTHTLWLKRPLLYQSS